MREPLTSGFCISEFCRDELPNSKASLDAALLTRFDVMCFDLLLLPACFP